jgi:hypothetical protein
MDPLSAGTAILAVITAALASSKSLYKIVRSYQDYPTMVKELVQELEEFIPILESIQKLAKEDALGTLALPLSRCSEACKTLERTIVRCGGNTDDADAKAKFKGWIKWKYMGDNVEGFTRMLMGYKLTMLVALADANM